MSKVMSFLFSIFVVCICANVYASDKFIQSLKFDSTNEVDILSAPQADASVLAEIPASQLRFPIKVEREQGAYVFVKIGKKQGWIKRLLINLNEDTRDRCKELSADSGSRPIITNSTQGAVASCQ